MGNPVIKCALNQIDSSTIDGNVEFVHSHVQLFSDVTSINSVFKFDKIVNNIDNFRSKCIFNSKISVILCILYFVFTQFLLNLLKHVN